MIHIYSTISGTLIKIKRADCEDWGGRMNIEKIIQEIVADFSQKNYYYLVYKITFLMFHLLTT